MLSLISGNTALSLPSNHQPKHLATPAQTRVKVTLATISRAWQTLTPQQRAGWNALGQTWSPGKKTTASGFAVFQSLNNVRFQTTGTTLILTDAPQKPDLLTELPPFTITAVNATVGGFSLLINSNAYTGLVRVSATPPFSPGVTRLRPEWFRNISALDSLTSPLTPLTEDYLARFPAPLVGMQIAIMLTPITDNGFCGQSVPVLVTVTAPAEPTLTLKK